MSAGERSAPGTKGWDVDLAHGVAGESELLRIVGGKVEVKRDRQAYSSGNVVVEYECRGKPSGIAVTEAPWWAFVLDDAAGNINGVYLVATARLRTLAIAAFRAGRIVAGGDGGEATMVQVRLTDLTGYTGQKRPPSRHAKTCTCEECMP